MTRENRERVKDLHGIHTRSCRSTRDLADLHGINIGSPSDLHDRHDHHDPHDPHDLHRMHTDLHDHHVSDRLKVNPSLLGQSTLYFLTPPTPKLNFWCWKLAEMIFPLSGTHWRLIQTFQLRLITPKYHFRATTSRISKRGDFWHFSGDISGT